MVPEDYETGIPYMSYPIAKRLFEINGVQKVAFDVYDIIVVIGKAFLWQEVEKNIIDAIGGYLRAQKEMEEGSAKTK